MIFDAEDDGMIYSVNSQQCSCTSLPGFLRLILVPYSNCSWRIPSSPDRHRDTERIRILERHHDSMTMTARRPTDNTFHSNRGRIPPRSPLRLWACAVLKVLNSPCSPPRRVLIVAGIMGILRVSYHFSNNTRFD